jgi:peptidoglycan/LPS O-acetylase OafA/YrhL
MIANGEEQGQRRQRETWLDGLRGIAAIIVVLCHFFIREIDMPFHSYFDEPAAQNRRIIQLAPFRLWIAGPAMVLLFFVISGWSISIRLVQLRGPGQPGIGFYRALASSAFRRFARLYIPLFMVGVVTHNLWYLGFYTWDVLSEQGCPNARPLSNPLPHLTCFARWVFDSLDIEHHRLNKGLNGQLWVCHS